MKRETCRWIFFSWLIAGLIGLPVFWVHFIGEAAVMASMSLKFWFFMSFFAFMIVGISLGRWSYAKEKNTKNGGEPK